MNPMLIAITLSSIVGMTLLAFLVRRMAAPWLCPLCTGVAGTWLWLLGAHLVGFDVDMRVPAILLGGSVVGLASLMEKLLPDRGETYLLVWKTMFVTGGFATAWFVAILNWGGAAVGLAVLAAITFLPWAGKSPQNQSGPSQRVERLKEQMKGCC